MLLASELGVSLAIIIQISVGQSTVSSNYFHQISIEVSTWNDITAPHTLSGLEITKYILLSMIHFLIKTFFNLRSSGIKCAALCAANPQCVAYYYSSECHEANGIGLMAALLNSPTAMTVYMDSSLNPGKIFNNVEVTKFLINQILIST